MSAMPIGTLRGTGGDGPGSPERTLVLEAGFLRLSLATATLGVLCYAASENRGTIAVMAGLAALLSLVMVSARPPRRLPRLALNLLVIAAGVNTALAVFTGSSLLGAGEGDLVSSLTDFLAVIVLIKMLDRGRPRDEAQLLCLSIFVVIGAVLTSNALLLGITMIAYVPTAIATAVLWQLHAGTFAQREAAERVRGPARAGLMPEPPTTAVHPALGRAPIRATLGVLTGLALLGAGGLFVLMPRTLANQAMGTWNLAGSGARTDFTPEITLGQSGILSVSEEQVGEVVVTDGNGRARELTTGPLYLRGAALDEYVPETGQWRRREREGSGSAQSVFRPFRSGAMVTNVPGGRGLDVTGGAGGEAEAGGELVQQITLRNAGPGRAALLAAWRPREVTFENTARVEFDADVGLIAQLDAPRPGRLAYSVRSWADAGGAAESEPAAAPGGREAARRDAHGAATAAPTGPFAAGPVRELAVRILAEDRLPSDLREADAAAIRRGARAIERYLRLNFAYSLEMVAPEAGQDPIVMFLTQTRRGHCEYFAAAMAGLLQSVGVESRVVTGYVVAEFNPLSGAYVIRRADAHAWVEARVGGAEAGRPARWETFDPTPPSSLPPSVRAGLANWVSDLRQVWEAVELAWIERVVSFEQTTASRRVDLVAAGMAARQRVFAVRRAIDQAVAKVRATVPGLGRGAALGVLALLAAGATVAAWSLGRAFWTLTRGRLLRAGARPHAGGPRVRFYLRLLDLLREAGVPKPEGRPPLKHARALLTAGYPARAAELAGELGERYYRIRFGGAAETREDERDADGRLAELAALLRTPPAPRPAAGLDAILRQP